MGGLILLLCLGAAPLTVSAAGDLQTSARTPEAQVAPLASLLQGDVRFINLEGPLTVSGHESGLAQDGTPIGQPKFNAPPEVARWLHGRVDVVSLANNHALDQGAQGLAETVEHLRAQGIPAATAITDAEVVRGNQRVRLIAREVSEAWSEEDSTALEARVREARATGPVLVSLHWGRTGRCCPRRSSAGWRLGSSMREPRRCWATVRIRLRASSGEGAASSRTRWAIWRSLVAARTRETPMCCASASTRRERR